MSNYIEHPESGQPQEPFLNTDPSVIEAKVMKDYAHFLGKDVLVSRISGFVGDDSTDIELSPPAKVRVESTSEQSLKRWIDGWCDPVYEVALVEDHPQLAGVRSLWIHGPSLHLNGKQTEASDIVSIADVQSPREVKKFTVGDGNAVMILVGHRMGLEPMLIEDATRQLEAGSIHPMTAAAMEKEAIVLNDRLLHDAALIDKANLHAEHIKAEFGFECELSKEAFLALQAEAEKLELAHASGQNLPEHESRLKAIDKLMDAASWTLHPDHGCILKSEVNARDRAVMPRG